MAVCAESGSGSGSGFNPEPKNTQYPQSPRRRSIAAGSRRGQEAGRQSPPPSAPVAVVTGPIPPLPRRAGLGVQFPCDPVLLKGKGTAVEDLSGRWLGGAERGI